jgi:phosphatidate cytidylyltransferase
MLGLQISERPALIAANLVVVFNYLLIVLGNTAAFPVFIPLGSLMVLALIQILQGKATGYVRTTGGLFWGLMVINYGIAHAAYLFIHPTFLAGPAGPAGWFLYLLILTEANDIFQALVGRSVIAAHLRHCICPTLSPKKTWEGFIGGLTVTIILAVWLAPWLTTLSTSAGPFALPLLSEAYTGPCLAGLVIAVSGFFGDINMSGIKRDCNRKDASQLLPGMGGVIDRIDSLTFAAPAFVYLIVWWL